MPKADVVEPERAANGALGDEEHPDSVRRSDVSSSHRCPRASAGEWEVSKRADLVPAGVVTNQGKVAATIR